MVFCPPEKTTGCNPNRHAIEALILVTAEIRRSPVRLVVYLIIYRVSYIPGGAGFQPSTAVLTGPAGSNSGTTLHWLKSNPKQPPGKQKKPS